jgi:hypothetical protein
MLDAPSGSNGNRWMNGWVGGQMDRSYENWVEDCGQHSLDSEQGHKISFSIRIINCSSELHRHVRSMKDAKESPIHLTI